MHLPTGLTRLAVPLLAGALVVAATVVPAVAAARTATAAVPTARTFGPVADDQPRWERENTCSPTEKPGATALRRLLRRTYGTAIASSTVRACSRGDSGHEEGRALDWMTSARVPAQKAMAASFLAWLQAPDAFGNADAMARRLGVEYVIWNNRTWRAYDPERGWTGYAGCLAKKKHKKRFANACHRTHMHISLSWDGAYKRTSYFSGYVVCPSFPEQLPVLAAPVGLDPVPVPPVRILGTMMGTGTPTGPCRVRGGTRFDLPVLGRGGLPATGVAAVMLQVGLLKADVSTTLSVWPAGGVMATYPVVAANPGPATALVTVAVGANGMVSLQHSAGMSHLTADVVGYYPSPVPVG